MQECSSEDRHPNSPKGNVPSLNITQGACRYFKVFFFASLLKGSQLR